MPYSVKIKSYKAKFSAAHFLYQHNKCSRIHGHNYEVVVEIIGDLDFNHFVVDFFELKNELENITKKLDHFLLIPENSNKMKIKKNAINKEVLINFNGKNYVFPLEDVVFLPIEATTAECLAKYIYDLLFNRFKEYKVKVGVGESEGSFAFYWE
ncbi:MAG: 6-pyruvoyl trahydropterin synthase family protein [Promethearchaeota archaeon]